MSATGSEIEIVNIREAVIELVRHHMKCVIPEGHHSKSVITFGVIQLRW
jgi:hypothetical protein